MFVTFITSITIILIGGAGFIASFSLPGEVFYPIKIHGNEKLVSAIAISSESEAQLQLGLIKERIDERNKLIVTGDLSDSLNKQIINQIDYHTDILQFHLGKISENDLAQQIESELNQLIQSVERQTSFLETILSENDNNVSSSEEISVDISSNTEIALKSSKLKEKSKEEKEVLEETHSSNINTEMSLPLRTMGEKLIKGDSSVDINTITN